MEYRVRAMCSMAESLEFREQSRRAVRFGLIAAPRMPVARDPAPFFSAVADACSECGSQ